MESIMKTSKLCEEFYFSYHFELFHYKFGIHFDKQKMSVIHRVHTTYTTVKYLTHLTVQDSGNKSYLVVEGHCDNYERII